jgi:hypothetical protein
MACSNDGCKKKVLEDGINTYRCEKCCVVVKNPNEVIFDGYWSDFLTWTTEKEIA